MDNLIKVLQFFGGIPTFLILFLIFVFVIHHKIRKVSLKETKDNNDFWQKEYSSLVVRKKELPENLYIHLEEKALPCLSLNDYSSHHKESLYTIQQSLHTIKDTKMLDLSLMLNSEIRLEFGTANLPLIEQYEENYLICIKNIFKLAKGLYEIGLVEDALKLLEEGQRIGTDITGHYQLMATIYQEKKKDYLIEELISSLKQNPSDQYVKIIQMLNKFINTNDHIH